MNTNLKALFAEADRASAAQDFARAQALFREAAAAQPDDPSILLKLAGVSRAAGQPRVALDAVHRALAISPLDFTALLMRANLLDRLGDAGGGRSMGPRARPEAGWRVAAADRPGACAGASAATRSGSMRGKRA